ncbi:AZOBR_p60025 family cell surface glycopolymer formation protein [Tengunoibacter tsumagoiensis]|uniref:Glycosyltransferase RgtA/B/C/D-like domain-containing protein n=1 Tax=Tengunoibacter tsumagoiensis TaxID=2014871 RepID=A0A401ZYB2_9CHLR|nr:glycosyltransferase 87 family protein [Tengunoibacter tsumagoiensis]GCE11831.1 hypothetical protein KTT_16900 [Tengunoibacter tsumagoiensis]
MARNNVALTQRSTLSIALWHPTVVIAVSYFALLIAMMGIRGYSVLDFVHLGTVWSQHKPDGTWGYDGQFYYQLAHDPLNAWQFMDNAPYRYQRILYPLLVSLLSLKFDPLIPYVLLTVNWLAIVLSVDLLARLLVKRGLSQWYSLAAGLYFGQAAGLTFDTAEPLVYFFICAGVWLLDEERFMWAAVMMGLAALTRETAILFPAGYLFGFVLQRQWRKALLFCAAGILPLCVWLGLLYLFFGRTGLTFSPPFEHLPFAGLFAFVQSPHKFWFLFLLLFLPGVLSGCMIVRELFHRGWWQAGPLSIWIMNLLMMVFLSRYSYMELISAGRIGTSLVFAGLLYALQVKDQRILFGLQSYALTFLVFVVGIMLPLSSFIG